MAQEKQGFNLGLCNYTADRPDSRLYVAQTSLPRVGGRFARAIASDNLLDVLIHLYSVKGD